MNLPSTKEILRMAAVFWGDSPTRPSDAELLSKEPVALIVLARNIGSFTDRQGRNRCVGCFSQPVMRMQRAMLAGIPVGFIENSYVEWAREYEGWHAVNGLEARQRPYADRSCEVCQEPLP